MSKNSTFILLTTALIATGSYGVYSIFKQESLTKTDSLEQQTTLSSPINENDTKRSAAKSGTEQQHQIKVLNDYKTAMAETTQLLQSSQYVTAVEFVDRHYQQLSTQELDNFESLFLNVATQLWQSDKTSQAITLLTSYSQIFNSLTGWALLSNIHLENQNWQAGINALLKAMPLEYQPDKLEALMAHLISASSSQRALLETQKDELGIYRLYKNLYQHHPNNGHFQLELASSSLRLNDISAARNLLELLQYDADYGSIAKTLLSKLENNSVAAIEQPASNRHKKDEIVVPLLRSGNSFFANTLINNQQHRLLLDTGASITALSQTTIESLKLKPTGRKIQLSTANGVTQARLYRADEIRLGSLIINNLVVAEIDFDKNSQVHGLLGTDLLNQLDNRYSYIIDNQKNALIFKSKN